MVDTAGRCGRWGHYCEGSFFDGDVGVEVGLGRADVDVAEPESVAVVSSRACSSVVAQLWRSVGMHVLGQRVEHPRCGRGGVYGDKSFDGVAAEASPDAGRQSGSWVPPARWGVQIPITAAVARFRSTAGPLVTELGGTPTRASLPSFKRGPILAGETPTRRGQSGQQWHN